MAMGRGRMAQRNSTCSCEGPSGGFSGLGSGMSPGLEGPPSVLVSESPEPERLLIQALGHPGPTSGYLQPGLSATWRAQP